MSSIDSIIEDGGLCEELWSVLDLNRSCRFQVGDNIVKSHRVKEIILIQNNKRVCSIVSTKEVKEITLENSYIKQVRNGEIDLGPIIKYLRTEKGKQYWTNIPT